MDSRGKIGNLLGITMDINEIRKLLKRHEEIPFPMMPDNKNVADWISDLAEIDAYYVGLAYSVLKGKPIPNDNLKPLQNLRQAFVKLNDLPSIDKKTLRECEAYLASLEHLVESIQ